MRTSMYFGLYCFFQIQRIRYQFCYGVEKQWKTIWLTFQIYILTNRILLYRLSPKGVDNALHPQQMQRSPSACTSKTSGAGIVVQATFWYKTTRHIFPWLVSITLWLVSILLIGRKNTMLTQHLLGNTMSRSSAALLHSDTRKPITYRYSQSFCCAEEILGRWSYY